MDQQDKQAIDGLFHRLREAEQQAQPRDPEAENFIREQIARQPGAPYYMAQTIVCQEYALEQAQARIAGLEQEMRARPASGGLFGSLFGGGQSAPPAPRPGAAPNLSPHSAPSGGPMAARPGGPGTGFLGGAAQTAMGVAGGVLLANAIGGMFGSGEAQAAETPPPVEPPMEPAAGDQPAGDESGGFFDGFFGGDDGGDF